MARHCHEAIRIEARRFGYFPAAFTWHGKRYDVWRVERCWTVQRRGWRNRVERLCFRVHCAEGVFDVYQDLVGNTWHIARRGLAIEA